MIICKMNSNLKLRRVIVLICNVYKLIKYKIYLFLNDVFNIYSYNKYWYEIRNIMLLNEYIWFKFEKYNKY